jgi:hypothetical protein
VAVGGQQEDDAGIRVQRRSSLRDRLARHRRRIDDAGQRRGETLQPIGPLNGPARLRLEHVGQPAHARLRRDWLAGFVHGRGTLQSLARRSQVSLFVVSHRPQTGNSDGAPVASDVS